MWFLRKPAEKPEFRCGLEVRVQFRDSKLRETADFRHFLAVNKNGKLDASGTERPAKIRSCNVPTHPATSHATPSAQPARCSEFQLTVCPTSPHSQSSPIPARSKARSGNRPETLTIYHFGSATDLTLQRYCQYKVGARGLDNIDSDRKDQREF